MVPKLTPWTLTCCSPAQQGETIMGKRQPAPSIIRTSVRGLFVLATLLVVSGTMPTAIAQERFGSFVGAVTDPSGALLPDVNVTITNKETNRELTTKTDSSGSYVFKNVEPGRYSFKF